MRLSLFFVFSWRQIGQTFSSTTTQCTEAERGYWAGKDDFTARYHEASGLAFGDCERTTDALFDTYGHTISRACLRCLGQATQCGRDNCLLLCVIPSSQLCKLCVEKYCISELLVCTGAATTAELPNAVRESSTTQAPLRTRRARTTTAETSDEASYQDRADDELSGSSGSY